jgi:hypothetical protein
MKTTQAWTWLAAGVVALGLNGYYHDGGLAMAHQVVDRISQGSSQVMARASEQADVLTSRVRMVADRNETASCRVGEVMARMQAQVDRAGTQMVALENEQSADGFARFDAMTARERAELDRLEAARARMEAQASRMPYATVKFIPSSFKSGTFTSPQISVCSRVRVNVSRIDIPQVHVSVPVVVVPTPVIHVTTFEAGPI